MIKVRYFIWNDYNWISRVSLRLYIFFLKKYFRYIIERIINHSQYLPRLPNGKQCACKFALCSSYMMEYCTFQFHSTVVSLPPRSVCIYTEISFSAILHTLIFPCYLYFDHITRVSWICEYIYIYTHAFFVWILYIYICSVFSDTPSYHKHFVSLTLGLLSYVWSYYLHLVVPSVPCTTCSSISGYTTYVWRHSSSKEAIRRKYPLICFINR